MINEEDFWKKYSGFNHLFGKAQSNITEYKGETIYGMYNYDLKGRHTVKFKLIYANPNRERGLHLFIHHFKGEIYHEDGKKQDKPKSKSIYAEIELPERVWRNNGRNEIISTIDLKDGYIGIENGIYDEQGKYFIVSTYWGAMKTEQISPTITRFYCNDTELEDDFDDLIFDLEILD